jgi:hypothetical protein
MAQETSKETEVLVDEAKAEAFLLERGTDRLREQHSNGVVNPIELAKALNVRPQMVYNYIRDNRIKSSRNDTGKIVVAWGEAVAFAQRYLNRKEQTAAKAAAQLASANATPKS